MVDLDGWDIAANRHLLAYFAKHRMPGRPPSLRGMQSMSRREHPNADADETYIAAVAVFVAYKNAWARDMREWEGTPSIEDQKRTWAECMQRADAQVALIRSGKAA